METTTVIAIVSAIGSCASAAFAAVAAWVSRGAARASARASLLVALDSRFSQINHAKIAHPELWPGIAAGGAITPVEQQLIFETFSFYQQAFQLWRDKLIRPQDGEHWLKRMRQDLLVVQKYRAWWNLPEESRFRSALDTDFVAYVAPLLAEANRRAG